MSKKKLPNNNFDDDLVIHKSGINQKKSLKNSVDSEKGVESEKSKEESLEENFYYALNHEIRRSMIRMIGNEGECSFTNFKKTLNASTGTLYHHLDVLKELVTQNSRRKYILTPLGMHAFNFLIKNYDSLESNNIDQQKEISKTLEKLINIFVPQRIYEKFNQNPTIGIVTSIFIIIISMLLVISASIDSSFIFFFPLEYEDPPIPINIKIWLGFKFIIAVIISAMVSEFLCRFLFQKRENTKKYLASYCLSLYPMTIYLVFYNLIALISQNFIQSPINKIIMVIFQFWSLWLLSYTLIKFKFIKLERSLIITLLIHYGSFSVILFSNL